MKKRNAQMKIQIKSLLIISLIIICSLQQQSTTPSAVKTDSITVKTDKPVDNLLMNIVKDKSYFTNHK